MKVEDQLMNDSYMNRYMYGNHNQSGGTFHCDGPNCYASQRGPTGGKPGNGWKGLYYGGKVLDFCSKDDCQKYRKKLKNKQEKVKQLEKNPQHQPVHQQPQQPVHQQPQQPVHQQQWQPQQPQQHGDGGLHSYLQSLYASEN